MLSKQSWIKPSDGLEFEWTQAEQEGRNLTGKEKALIQAALSAEGAEREELAERAYQAVQALDIRPDYPYREPSDLEGIQREAAHTGPLKVNAGVLEDKIYGAWLARCAGCLLGQPVEGWRSARINGLLKDTGNYPAKGYISSDIAPEIRERYGVKDGGQVYGSAHINWINHVHWMPEDDDTNYTVIALKLLENYGMDFTPEDAAECWLMNLPYLHVCTAERVAYRNLVMAKYPPLSASFANPYREWIGAQIRADLFGYVTPGKPALGAELAWRDASMSHVKNGIYGEMWMAAMLSAAAVESDVERILQIGLGEIPTKSRLHEAILVVMDWKKQGFTWEKALEEIHALYDEANGHDWCHTISNAMIVAAALLFGEKDLGMTLAIALQAGFDTDCNAASAGSVLGMILGAKALPKAWTEPLNDTLISGVDGFGKVKISELAARTTRLAEKNL